MWGDFRAHVSREILFLGEVISMDLLSRIRESLDNLGQIISEGGVDMQKRAEKELYTLGQVIAEEQAKEKR
jgi:hypothetical protein